MYFRILEEKVFLALAGGVSIGYLCQLQIVTNSLSLNLVLRRKKSSGHWRQHRIVTDSGQVGSAGHKSTNSLFSWTRDTWEPQYWENTWILEFSKWSKFMETFRSSGLCRTTDRCSSLLCHQETAPAARSVWNFYFLCMIQILTLKTFAFYIWYKYWHLQIEGLLVKPQAMSSPRTPDTPTDEKKRETVSKREKIPIGSYYSSEQGCSLCMQVGILSWPLADLQLLSNPRPMSPSTSSEPHQESRRTSRRQRGRQGR